MGMGAAVVGQMEEQKIDGADLMEATVKRFNDLDQNQKD